MKFASQEAARAYIRARDARALKITRLTKPALQVIFGDVMRQRGMERHYGKSSKDELIAEILELEFPDIKEARTACADHAAYYEAWLASRTQGPELLARMFPMG